MEERIGHLILVWVHLTAATFWVGGMLFLSIVAVPLLRQATDPASAQRSFVALARRFRTFVWGALALLVVSGVVLFSGQVSDVSAPLSWPPAVFLKLFLVLVLITVSLVHDQVVGPKVRTLMHKNRTEWSSSDQLLVRLSPLIGRLTMLLGLAVLFAAVILVRS